MKKIFIIIAVLAVLFTATSCGTALHEPLATGADAVVVFYPTANLDPVNFYTWSDEELGGWPGTEMDAVFYIVVNGTFGGAKFNDGKDGLTGDLDAIDAPGVYLYNSDAGWDKVASTSGKVVVMYPATTTDPVYFYTWSDEELGGWPGAEMELGAYVKIANTFGGAKFNDGKDGLTGDLDGINANGAYEYDGDAGWTLLAN